MLRYRSARLVVVGADEDGGLHHSVRGIRACADNVNGSHRRKWRAKVKGDMQVLEMVNTPRQVYHLVELLMFSTPR